MPPRTICNITPSTKAALERFAPLDGGPREAAWSARHACSHAAVRGQAASWSVCKRTGIPSGKLRAHRSKILVLAARLQVTRGGPTDAKVANQLRRLVTCSPDLSSSIDERGIVVTRRLVDGFAYVAEPDARSKASVRVTND